MKPAEDECAITGWEQGRPTQCRGKIRRFGLLAVQIIQNILRDGFVCLFLFFFKAWGKRNYLAMRQL